MHNMNHPHRDDITKRRADRGIITISATAITRTVDEAGGVSNTRRMPPRSKAPVRERRKTAGN